MVRLIVVVVVVGVRFEQFCWCSCCVLRLLSLLFFFNFSSKHTTGNVTRQTLTHQLNKTPRTTSKGIKRLASIAYNDAESIPKTIGASVLKATSSESDIQSELTTTVPIIGKFTRIPLNAGNVCASARAAKKSTNVVHPRPKNPSNLLLLAFEVVFSYAVSFFSNTFV